MMKRFSADAAQDDDRKNLSHEKWQEAAIHQGPNGPRHQDSMIFLSTISYDDSPARRPPDCKTQTHNHVLVRLFDLHPIFGGSRDVRLFFSFD